ncbi:MAG: MFS transporter [Candidatus Cryptobacteroides sp.]
MWNKNFLLLWIGQAISQIGNRIYVMALAWYIVAVMNSPGKMIVLFIISSLPSLLFGTLIGPLVEKWNKKTVIVACDIISGILTGILATMIYFGYNSLWIIYLISFLLNTVNLFFSPSVNSILPTVIPADHYRQGTSLMKMMTFLSQIMGAAVGGMLVGFFGVFWSIAINAASFLISAAMSLFVVFKPMVVQATGNYIKNIKEGFRYLSKDKTLSGTMSIAVIVNLFLPSFIVIVPIVIKNGMNLDAIHYGIVDAAIPIGAVLVSLLLSVMKGKEKMNPLKTLSKSIIGIALMYILVAIFKNYAAILIAGLAFGFLSNNVNIKVLSYFIENVEPQFRGRVFSLLESLSYASISISYIIVSILSSKYDIYVVMIVNGLCLLVIAAASLLIASRTNRQQNNLNS